MNPSKQAMCIAAAALVALAALLVGPGWVVGTAEKLSRPDYLRALSDVRTSILQFYAGSALITGGIYTARTFHLAQRKDYADRFATAATAMGETTVAGRVGGIYIMWSVANESSQLWPQAEELLASFLREHAKVPNSADPQEVPGDVVAAATIFGRRPPRSAAHAGPTHNLRGVYLRNIDLTRANLERVDLSDADLVEAKLSDSMLTNSVLARADLSRARLNGATLVNTDFTHAKLVNVSFHAATLRSTNFNGADLTGAEDYVPE